MSLSSLIDVSIDSLGGVKLLERHTQQAELRAALADADAGQGSVVLVMGEAGAGKTTLLREFSGRTATSHHVFWGVCDELLTPRPFGPFRDMITQMGGNLADTAGSAVLDAVIAKLRGGPRSRIVVIEDAHWADEATLDAIRFLGRRVRSTPALLVITFRDDELPTDHPLRAAVSSIPPADVRRIKLPPLSRLGVAQLAGREDVDELYRITGGNPFLLTELLGATDSTVPLTIRDAVMARVGRLSDQGRAGVEVAAVVPGRAEKTLLEACGVADGVHDTVATGVLHEEGDVVRFSHELARHVVEQSLGDERSRALNQQVYEALAAIDCEPARLVHHAARAGDSAAVARHAPVAARRAAAMDSHVEAIAHLEQALNFIDAFSNEELSCLLVDLAYECYLTGRNRAAEDATDRALKLYQAVGNDERVGHCLVLLSEIHWSMGRGHEAHNASSQALATLKQRPGGSTLAWAYAQRARLAMVDRRPSEAFEWGDKATALAQKLSDHDVLVHVLNTIGTARSMLPPYDNALLLESLEVALASKMKVATSRSYINLAIGYLDRLSYCQVEGYLTDGLAFSDSHDLTSASHRLVALRSLWHLEQGRWADAEAGASSLLDVEDVSRLEALIVLGLLQARRGNEAAATTIDRAEQLARRMGDAQHLLPVGVAKLETAWLAGSLEDMAQTVQHVMQLAQQSESPRWIGESALWAYRAGHIDASPSAAMSPFASQISGQCQAAATEWSALGRPYAEADALADADEPEPVIQALKILDQLEARPRAAMARQRLAGMGVTSIPRGPRKSTRANVAGLTVRQTDVLELLAEDLTYQQIAQRLCVSTKTVDHHAAAVRMKLGVSTSAAAVVEARRLGILAEEREPSLSFVWALSD